MRLRAFALAAGILGLLSLGAVACGPGAGSSPTPSPGPNSGIRGIVLLGPTCPVQSVDASPCLTPYAARLVIVDSDGNKVSEISSGPDGHFQIALPPGLYEIQPTPDPSGFPTATPISVTVVDDDYVDVEVDYDTGIR